MTPFVSHRRSSGALFAGFLLATASSALAAQTDITISMDKAPATPRINGAAIIGSIPGSPFLHTLSVTGQAPLSFAATGLPAGLALDATSGTISGTTPAAESYSFEVTVTNAVGSASRTLTLVAGSTLALTPPMGWNSYDSFYQNVTEADVKAAAQAVKTYLQPYGWNTVVIDYLWYDPEKTTDANGRWLPSKSKYPNANGADGFKPLAAQVHALGLGFGIHLMRGIPRKSFTANTPVADSTYTANQAGNSGDTCAWDDHMYGVRADTAAGKAWYDSIYKQYAGWDVDFVKVDDMMNPYGGNAYHGTEVEAVHNAIVKTGRSIVLSLSPGPNQTRDVASLNLHANMWRTVNDFWDTDGLSNINDEFTAANAWANTSGITPGHWPDADMLPLGTIGNRPCAFSKNQQVLVMTLWSIMPSPLMFGGMPTKLANDAWTLALLTNEEVLAVNQDALGARGKRIAQQGTTEVWAKDLSGGRKAVALFNRGTQDATVSITFAQLGMTGTPPVRDLWHRSDLTNATTGISVNVPHESALMYAVGAATGGSDGGVGGAGGAGGAGGSSATGGASGSGGAVGGSDGGAGRGGATGSGGRSGSGGSSASGGSSGSGGSPATGGASALGGAVAGGASGTGGVPVPGSTGSGGAIAPGSGGSSASGGASASGGSSATSGGSGGSRANGSGGSAGGAGQGNASASGCACSLGARGDAFAWPILLSVAALVAIRARRRSAKG